LDALDAGSVRSDRPHSHADAVTAVFETVERAPVHQFADHPQRGRRRQAAPPRDLVESQRRRGVLERFENAEQTSGNARSGGAGHVLDLRDMDNTISTNEIRT
jgi:hypothetical protein